MGRKISCLYTILFYKDNKFKGIYIGITNDFINRMSQHKSEAKNKYKNLPVYNAMRKYTYKMVKVAEIYDRELLNDMEIFTIKYARDLGLNCYNLTKGGEGTCGVGTVPINMFDMAGNLIKTFESIIEASEYVGGVTSPIGACAKGKESKSAYGYVWRYVGDSFDKYDTDNALSNSVRRVLQYDLEGNLIATFDSNKDVERKLGISNSHISACCLGKVGVSFGYVWRYEGDTFDKFKIHRDNSTRVCKYDNKGNLIETYHSIKQAGDVNDVMSQNIFHCCNGGRVSCGGFIWRYEGDSFDKFSTIKKKTRSKIAQYSFEGGLINIFNSGKEVERILGISQTAISSCCLGKRKTAGGYKWEYIEQ